MKTAILTALVGLTSVGCTHYRNVERVDASGLEVYESSRVDRNGVVRATVQERLADATDGCRNVRLQREFYSPTGTLQRRVIERQHCGYTVLRIVEHSEAGGWARETQVDSDLDGYFDRQSTRTEAGPVLADNATR